MKEEYSELVKFCDGLLIDDFNQTKQINDLKKEKLKLIQAVDILNQTIKEKDHLLAIGESCCNCAKITSNSYYLNPYYRGEDCNYEIICSDCMIKLDIVFRCVDCNIPITRNSPQHDKCKCDDKGEWYCKDCFQEEEC